jgi:hypothetical protein
MQLILGNVSVFKSTPLPMAGSFTETVSQYSATKLRSETA